METNVSILLHKTKTAFLILIIIAIYLVQLPPHIKEASFFLVDGTITENHDW